MTESMFFSGPLFYFLDLYNDLKLKDQFTTEFADIQGNVRKVEFQKIQDPVNPKKEYLGIKTEDQWILINRREFLKAIKDLKNEYREMEERYEMGKDLTKYGPKDLYKPEDLKDPINSIFIFYIEKNEYTGFLHLFWGFPGDISARKSFRIISTNEEFNKIGKMLNDLKDHLNTLTQKGAKNENQDQNKYLKG